MRNAATALLVLRVGFSSRAQTHATAAGARYGCIHRSCKVKVKVNFTLEQDTKVYRESRGIVLLFL